MKPMAEEPLIGEAQVRELVADAVRLARRTTPGNVSDEACVQWTMKDNFIQGRWRSTLFYIGEDATLES
jgi:hypothetical protein